MTSFDVRDGNADVSNAAAECKDGKCRHGRTCPNCGTSGKTWDEKKWAGWHDWVCAHCLHKWQVTWDGVPA